MKISITLIAVIVALIIVVLDYQLGLGIVAFLSDFFIILLVVALLLGVVGVRTRI